MNENLISKANNSVEQKTEMMRYTNWIDEIYQN